MTVADDIVSLVGRKQHRLALTEEDIAEMLFGQAKGYQQRVNSACRQLVAERRLRRLGGGGQNDPYTYRLPFTEIKRRA